MHKRTRMMGITCVEQVCRHAYRHSMQWTPGGRVFEDISRTKNIQIPALPTRLLQYLFLLHQSSQYSQILGEAYYECRLPEM